MADLSAEVEAGKFSELVRYHSLTSDSICVRFDKATLHSFYRSLPDSFPVYRLLPTQRLSRTSTVNRDQPRAAFSVYPNPATEVATATFDTPERHAVRVLDAAGREIWQTSSSAAAIQLPMSLLSTGTYTIQASATNSRPVFHRLSVVR
ncbi:T9SS type A sorting domain-containing protein [Hymenobacter pini]|uniref:T9SS type A sorting domain-containing protein n=1 Tax=Hymenobacter pini TaxID=2880879 RepID=UPI001CF45CBC|nr:T9SS type A sorting domain-containing protein [Hymenobacter pini]MCA8831754.1 T9SS type A sorting domain-containing protein [Hymenobacter pini]